MVKSDIGFGMMRIWAASLGVPCNSFLQFSSSCLSFLDHPSSCRYLSPPAAKSSHGRLSWFKSRYRGCFLSHFRKRCRIRMVFYATDTAARTSIPPARAGIQVGPVGRVESNSQPQRHCHGCSQGAFPSGIFRCCLSRHQPNHR